MKLRCVECKAAFSSDSQELKCMNCGAQYLKFKDRPVFVNSRNELFDFSTYDEELSSTHGVKLKVPAIFRLSASVNTERENKISHLSETLKPGSTVLLIGAGNQVGKLREAFQNSVVIAFDVDTSADVDFFADAHEIPLVSNSVDLVICTAVLEHLIEPWNAVEEIYRVLTYGGRVYSEVPFLQHVHEGAYDFTRFTLMGHELLYKKFKILDSGSVAGPFTTLSWEIEFLVSLLTRRAAFLEKLMKALVRVLLLPLRAIDFVISSQHSSFDAASCTFVLAEKIDGYQTDWNLEGRYKGGRKYVRQL